MATHFYVDPIKVANSYGIKVEPYKEVVPDDLCGEIEKTEEGIVIRYNPMHHENRQRFTIAHELGHYLLGHLSGEESKQFRDVTRNFTSATYNPKEVAANRMAAQILMPADKLDFLIYKKGVTSIKELAKIMRVSEAAMLYRLKNLGWIR